MIGKIGIALVAAAVAFIMGMRVIAQRAPRPDRMGVANSQLIPCPDTANCVSSFEGLDPLTYTGNRNSAITALVTVLQSWPRAEVVQVTETYIHVEFRSRVFSFIDDGEFYFPSKEGVIHFRSSARTGSSDFGINEQRIQEIATLLQSVLE